MDKLHFLKTEFPKLLQTLKPDAKGNWGVLNGIQMVEHMADSVKEATGKLHLTILTPEDRLEKVKEFALSDKDFKPNTQNIKMPTTPSPARNKTMQEAISEFENEVVDFLSYFENNKGGTLPNSFFGNLNFEEWTHLLSKHAKHHCKQFGLL